VPIRAQPAFPLGGLDKSGAFRAALAAGGIAALLSLLPLGFIVGAPLGGFLSVLLYAGAVGREIRRPALPFDLGHLAAYSALPYFCL